MKSENIPRSRKRRTIIQKQKNKISVTRSKNLFNSGEGAKKNRGNEKTKSGKIWGMTSDLISACSKCKDGRISRTFLLKISTALSFSVLLMFPFIPFRSLCFDHSIVFRRVIFLCYFLCFTSHLTSCPKGKSLSSPCIFHAS